MLDLPRASGGDLRLFVGWPEEEPPPQGWPVIYLLDGDSYFAPMLSAARALSLRPQSTGVEPAVIVGIAPACEETRMEREARRCRDFTPPAPRDLLPPRPHGRPWGETGAADSLLDWIETAAKPQVEALLPVDRTRQTLFGHSLGGLCALYAAFSRPERFQCYAASSPSIWFAERWILKAEAEFAEALRAAPPPPKPLRLHLTVGSLESEPPEHLRDLEGPYALWVRNNRMVENLAEMVERLAAMDPRRLEAGHAVLEGENHPSAAFAALSRALRAALRP